MENFKSDISQMEFPLSERISASTLRQSLYLFIKKQYPNFNSNNYISVSELKKFREKYITEDLLKDLGELTELEKTVLKSLSEKTTLSDKFDDEEDTQNLTYGQRLADIVAKFGGSWKFIITFGVFIWIWILTNFYIFLNQGFDPYPFILLNLILSCLAALQAPVIMMSQNRREEKDRERAKKDYMINLKSELEIRILHEKIDHLIMHQNNKDASEL